MLRCSVCHETYEEILRLWRCPCGGALSLEIDETFFPGPEELKRESPSARASGDTKKLYLLR